MVLQENVTAAEKDRALYMLLVSIIAMSAMKTKLVETWRTDAIRKK